jgi:hypothetical protein
MRQAFIPLFLKERKWESIQKEGCSLDFEFAINPLTCGRVILCFFAFLASTHSGTLEGASSLRNLRTDPGAAWHYFKEAPQH